MLIDFAQIDTKTGATPVKINDQPFPSFESTNVSAEQSNAAANSSSYTNSSSNEPDHKRRRLSDASPSDPDDITPAVADFAMQSQSNALASIDTANTATDNTVSSSSQDSRNPGLASTTEASPNDNSLERQTEIKPVVTPSKIKKAGPSGLQRKKPVVAQTNRGMKVSSAGAGARKATKTSSLAVPKRYRT